MDVLNLRGGEGKKKLMANLLNVRAHYDSTGGIFQLKEKLPLLLLNMFFAVVPRRYDGKRVILSGNGI